MPTSDEKDEKKDEPEADAKAKDGDADEADAKAKDDDADAKAKDDDADDADAKAKDDDAEKDDSSKDDSEESEEEEKPAPKAAKSAKSARASAARSTSPKRGTASSRRAQQGKQSSSLGKSMILFVVIIGGLAAGFALLGREENHGPPKPKWTTGQTVDVEITLVKNDKADLSCASGEEIGGKHCAFEAINKPWSKGPAADDAQTFKPYTTTDRVQFVAAGVWSQAALAGDKMPKSRFSVKCKYKVEGMLKNLSVRWDPTSQWHPNTEWFAGSVSDCKLAP